MRACLIVDKRYDVTAAERKGERKDELQRQELLRPVRCNDVVVFNDKPTESVVD